MKKFIRYSILFLLCSIQNLSCTTAGDPDNLEPVLIILEATDITRNEATIAVKIETRGTGRISHLRFFYGEGDDCKNQTEIITPESEEVCFRLKNLKAGTTYSFYAQGGTTTATIDSNKMKFKTDPNVIPVISGAIPIASGPVGIIVEFEIMDDGGDPIKVAGCDVTDLATNSTQRFYVSESNITPGKIKIHAGGLSPLTSYIIVPFATNSIGESKGESLSFTTQNSIIIKSPGTLSRLFDNDEINLENLIISGQLNGDDFRFLRRILKAPVISGENEMKSNVVSVDITDVDIVEGGSTYDGSHFTETDIITPGLFADCVGMENIKLPLTAVKIATDAFKGCIRLSLLTIPANISELLPSSGCIALEKIEVSDANVCYKSIDGVLFNRDATEILWFPMGKTGEYSLPSSVTSIGINAFRYTKITSIIIPSGVRTISRGAFSGSSLKSITLPDNMTNISEGLFQECVSLKTVYLGKSTEYLRNYIFDGCKIEEIYIAATIPPFVSTDSFTNKACDIFTTCKLFVPEGMKKQYINHPQWGKFKTIIEF